MMKVLKQKTNSIRGITLVALVVTIVVLLILAGITLVYVFGDNGVFNKATQAKIQTELGKIEEQAETIYAEKLIEKQTGKIETISNRDIVDKLISNGNLIEIRNSGAGSVEKISLEPEEATMDQGQTTKIKVKIEGPEDGNLYYAVIDGKYYKMNFENTQLTIEKRESTPEGNIEEQAEIEVETGYDTTIVTKVQINQVEKAIEITSGEKYDSTTLTIKYGGKTANCEVTVKAVESNWAELSEIAKAIANDDNSVSSDGKQAIVTVNGESKSIKVGDIYRVKLKDSGELKRVRVLGFKHDTLVKKYDGTDNANDSAKAGISFEFIDFITGSNYMNLNPEITTSGGWGSTQLRQDLNGYESSSYIQEVPLGGMASNLSNSEYIKQVKKKFGPWPESTDTRECNDYLWLLAASEIWNTGMGSTSKYGYSKANEGAQYAFYKDGPEPKDANPKLEKRTSESGELYWWFIRSTGGGSKFDFTGVDSEGRPNPNRRPASGIAPSFCL